MKKLVLLLSFFLMLLSAQKTAAQIFSLLVSHTSSERSKDSHSTTETFNLTGKNLSYTVTYSGRKGPNQKDEEKKCVLTDEQVNKISATLQEKKLNVTDSLINNLTGMEAPYTAETITITVTKGNKITKIRVKGTSAQVSNKTVYSNSLYLINMISRMLKTCS